MGDNIKVILTFSMRNCLLFFGINSCIIGTMRIAKRVGLGIVLLIIIATFCQPVSADSSTSRWFPITRHFVQGDFLDFYQNAPDPLTLFGYPITEAFTDQTGRLTQYFQRARFDLVMTEKGPTVILAKLGWMLYDENGKPPGFLEDPLSCRLFPSTGKNVCYTFLQFYDSYHGEIYFGEPISGAELRDGRIVQYFEKARMEYLKNLPEGHRVILTKLGDQAADIYLPQPKEYPGAIPGGAPQIETLAARAFVSQALVARGMKQTVFLIVNDQDLRPVRGAEASVTVVKPNGAKFIFRPRAVTDANGILKFEVLVPTDLAPRQAVIMDITAEIQGMKTKTATWFRLWY